MDFKRRILSAIKADPDCDWDAIVNHRNVMQCYKFNSAVARALRKNGIEAFLVGTHYPKETPNCSNYYVLARDRDSGQVVLIDAWINSIFDGMKEPFIGSMDEAKQLMATILRERPAETIWNLDHIVISKYNPDIPTEPTVREDFRKHWGEFGESLVFDVPQKAMAATASGEPKQVPFGERPSINEMNRYAARKGLSTNFLIPKGNSRE